MLASTHDRVDRARLRACAGPDAGLWLSTAPSSDESSLSDEHFRRAFAFRSGSHQVPPGANCRLTGQDGACCPKTLDPKGMHALCCGLDGAYHVMHDVIRKWGHEACQAAGLWAKCEVVVPYWAKERKRGDVISYEELLTARSFTSMAPAAASSRRSISTRAARTMMVRPPRLRRLTSSRGTRPLTRAGSSLPPPKSEGVWARSSMISLTSWRSARIVATTPGASRVNRGAASGVAT